MANSGAKLVQCPHQGAWKDIKVSISFLIVSAKEEASIVRMLWATALWLRRLHGAYMHSRNANINAIFISNVISDLRRTQTRGNDQRRGSELRHERTFNAYFIVIDIFASLLSAAKELSPAKFEGLLSQHTLSKAAQR
jgi:hypothetical protein